MIEAGGGSIINISSGASVFGVPGLGPYSAGKGGMNSLTRVIAADYGRQGVRCNTIIVGRVVSYAADRGPDTTKEFLRVGNPQDIGYAALWLAADESEWITGSEITADGGARYNASRDLGRRDQAGEDQARSPIPFEISTTPNTRNSTAITAWLCSVIHVLHVRRACAAPAHRR